MTAIAGLVASVAVVLSLWLGLSAPNTTPVDPAAQGDGNGNNGGGGGNDGGGGGGP